MLHADHQLPKQRPPVRALRRPLLGRVPLAARAGMYYLAFLALALVLLPSLAHRLALMLPGWQVELGPGRAVGWVVFGCCYVGYTFAACVLIRRGRGAHVEFDPPKQFVATGPFRWCRNPLAICLLGMLFGEALAFSSLGILLLALVGLPLAHLQVTLLEEPLLKKRFGQAYLDYLLRVPRWIPRPPRKAPP